MSDSDVVKPLTLDEAADRFSWGSSDLKIVDSLTAAIDTEHTGAMIALVPVDPAGLTVDSPDAESADELHLTLYYLGEAAAWSPQAQEELVKAVEDVAMRRVIEQVDGKIFGADLWNPNSDTPAWVYAVGDDPTCGDGEGDNCLGQVHDHVGDAILAAHYAVGDDFPEIPDQHSPWVPHICAAYSADPTLLTALLEHVGPVTFDRIRVAFAGENTDISLGGGSMTVLDETELGGKPNPGTPADKRLKRNKKAGYEDEESVELQDEGVSEDVVNTWEGVLVVEGEVTGDGREFAPDSITWPDPELTIIPLRWNVEDSHGGDKHTVAVNVGRIERIWRDGSKIMGAGTMNVDDENGLRALRMMENGYLGGISIDADDISDADVEYVWPESDDDTAIEDEGDIISILFGTPEKMIFHAGRIRAATLCDIPAFVDASIALKPADSLAASVTTFDAVAPHHTDTSDGAWDGSANEKNLPSPCPMSTAKEAYAWVDASAAEDGGIPKSAGKFIHHEINADGSVGAANLTACSTGIGVLHGGRGGTDASNPRGIYDHLAAHLRDGGQEPPPFQDDAEALVAAATEDAWRPPRQWFTDPKFQVPTPIIVTDQGRVYGHAAEWGQCHIGYPGECVTPPFENDHPYFLTGNVVTDAGEKVPVGQITADIGHAPLSWSANRAAGHYDNTEFVVADVVIGNDKHGIWVAGAIRPWATERQVHALRASGQVSPDWRQIGGSLRMVGLLTVNASGFQQPRARAFVASGKIRSLVSSGFTSTHRSDPRVTEAELNQRALRLMADHIRDRVNKVR